MFETIKRIFGKTRNAEAVTKAKDKGWITAAEADAILSMAAAPEVVPE